MYQVQFRHSWINGKLVKKDDRVMEVSYCALTGVLVNRLYSLYHNSLISESIYSQKLYSLIEAMMQHQDCHFYYDSDWVKVEWKEDI